MVNKWKAIGIYQNFINLFELSKVDSLSQLNLKELVIQYAETTSMFRVPSDGSSGMDRRSLGKRNNLLLVVEIS